LNFFCRYSLAFFETLYNLNLFLAF
jgi:hypothetical protein